MGPITYSADISKPHLWPLHTLRESRELLLQRISHVNTKPANRIEAQRRLDEVEKQIIRKTVKRTR